MDPTLEISYLKLIVLSQEKLIETLQWRCDNLLKDLEKQAPVPAPAPAPAPVRESKSRCFFNQEQIKDIRTSKELGIDLAKKYNVTPAVISQIRTRKTYAGFE